MCKSWNFQSRREFSTIGRLREILIAESQTQAQIRQAAQQEVTQEEVNLDGGMTEGNETSEPAVDAREKLKRSKGKK